MTTSGPTLSIIPSAAVIDPHLTAPDIRVLALLGTHADRVGRCWPSIPTLAKPLGVSPRWVQRCLRKLERLKYVSTHPRPGRASIYEIKGVNQEFRGEPGVQGRGEPGVQGGVNQEFTQNDTKNDTKERNRCFEEFWSSFPSRNPHANPKKPARLKFNAVLGQGVLADDLIRGAKNYAIYVVREKPDPKFVAQATTWLNQERWTQYQTAPTLPNANPALGTPEHEAALEKWGA